MAKAAKQAQDYLPGDSQLVSTAAWNTNRFSAYKLPAGVIADD
jgi:hypothetical protein